MSPYMDISKFVHLGTPPHPVNWQNDIQADRHNSKHSLLAISLSIGKNVNLQTTDS